MSLNVNFRDLEGFEFIAKKNPHIEKEVWRKNENFFDKVERKINQLVPERLQKKYEKFRSGLDKLYGVGFHGTRFLHEVVPQAGGLVFSASHVSNLAGQFFQHAEIIAKKIAKFKIVTFLSIPFVVFEVAMKVAKLVKGALAKAASRVVDAILELGESAADITRIVAVLSSNSIVGTVAGFLSVFSVALNSKELYHNIKFHKKIQSKIGNKENPIADISDRKLDKHLDVFDKGMFRARIQYISKNNELDKVNKAFKRKTIQKGVSSVLRIIASVVSIVATAILLIAPPLAPVAFGLYAGASLIKLADFIVDRVITHHFMKVIERHAPSDAPEVQQYKQNYDRFKKLGLV